MGMAISKYNNIVCSIYLMIYALYRISSSVYPGTIVSRVLMLLFMVFSLYFLMKSFSILRVGPGYIKWLFVLLTMFILYGLIYFLSPNTYTITEGLSYQDVPKIEYLKNIFLSILPIFAFYYFASKGMITETWIRANSLILLALAVTLFLYKYNDFVINDEYGRTEMTNNFGYYFVALFPLLCFWNKRPIIQFAYMVVLLVFIIISMKRGAMLSGVICAIYFINSIFRNATNWGRFVIILALGFLVYFGLPIFSDFIAGSEYFQFRLQQTMAGDSSNRDVIYATAVYYIFNETTLLEFLFGTGADSSIAVLTNYAHNDWLEIGINQGIIGVFIYALYFVSFFKLWRRNSKTGILGTVCGMCFIICFLATIFSMSYNSIDLSLSLCIGYVCAASKTLNYNALKRNYHLPDMNHC